MKTGDKIICIKECCLGYYKNKIYIIDSIYSRFVVIYPNAKTKYPNHFEMIKSKAYYYFYDYFATLEEFRENRLNLILDESR